MVAAKRQELAYPLRWYSIPNFWRYERPQRGRLREFWQLNVDLFGIQGVEADFEMVQIADALMQAFEAKRNMYTIKVNSRKIVDHILQSYIGLNVTQVETIVRLIDRMHKIERSEFVAKLDAILTPSQREINLNDKILTLLEAKSLKDISEKLAGHEAISELSRLLELAKQTHISNIEFDITLMRGFDYYTGIVFEIFDNHPENNRSMFGGGRYDGLVSQFGVEGVPTVGFGAGDVTFQNFLELHGLMPQLKTETEVYVVLIGDVFERAQKVIGDLRGMGVNVAVDSSGKKLDKQLKTALKKAIPHVIFIGDQELEDGQFKFKNLQTGKEEAHSIERIVTILKDYRKK
jgi:histidyl-tRNA synthetase